MQERHRDVKLYFDENERSCERYYLPFIREFLGVSPGPGYSVMEVGCARGGNLAPFAKAGCDVTGLDIYGPSIEAAENIFREKGLEGAFICSDIHKFQDASRKYDLIILRDVIEHIHDKQGLLIHLKSFLKPDGVVFLAFPAWQMPFGGHQQVAESRTASRMPFIHLLPRPLYRAFLRTCGETQDKIEGLMEIRNTRITIESFYKLLRHADYRAVARRDYLINPHYEVKFGLKPRVLSPLIGRVPYLRNFFITSCFCIVRPL